MSDLVPTIDENTVVFLFSSSAHFVGSAEATQCKVHHCWPSFNAKDRKLKFQQGPLYRCDFALSVKFPAKERTGGFAIIETYEWLGDRVAPLLSCVYGKLIEYRGQLQSAGHLTLPNLETSINPSFEEPPFNSKPRTATKTELNFKNLNHLLEKILFEESEEKQMLINAGMFYQLALENWVNRPALAYSSLISSLEAVLPLRDYTNKELFDDRRIKDFELIQSLPDGDKIVNRFKGSLYSIRRKLGIFVTDKLPETFFEEPECKHDNGLLKKENLGKAMKAAYDLRSKFLHTGNSIGYWPLEQTSDGLEVPMRGAVIHDRAVEKLVNNTVTLTGLERITSTILNVLCHEYLVGPIQVEDCDGEASDN